MQTIKDAHQPYKIKERIIDISTANNIAVEQDNNSQIISFILDRYFDNIDLSEKAIYIKYINANGEGDKSVAVHLEVEENTIKFGWLIDSKVTIKEGKVTFAVEITDSNGYTWNTIPATITVEKGLNIDGHITLAEPSWFKTYLLKIEDKISKSIEDMENKLDDKFYIHSSEAIPFDLGGFNAGSNPFVGKGMSCSDAFIKLLYPTIRPSVSISSTVSDLQEISNIKLNNKITVNISKGTNTLKYIYLYKDDTIVKEYSNITDDIIFHYNDAINKTTVYTVKIFDGISEITSKKIIEFTYPSFFGVISSSNPSQNDIVTLNRVLLNTSKFKHICRYSPISQYMCYCYPKTYGNLLNITDLNTGFSLINGWSKETINIITDSDTSDTSNSIPYNLYLSDKITLYNYIVQFEGSENI